MHTIVCWGVYGGYLVQMWFVLVVEVDEYD